MSGIAIQNVGKSYGAVTALKGIDFDILPGEFFSLLGPSGCGKTTLLKILAGMEKPSVGKVVIDGIDCTNMPANLRPTNMVFQSYAIFPHMSVADNIAYGLRTRGLGRDARIAEVNRMLELINMTGYGKRQPTELSGGQLQRVALARALVLKPKVLLLDEPLSALDRKLREKMQVELKAIQREVGITFVFVTHDQDEALAMSDRVAVMSDGNILQIDTPQALYLRPRNRFVAEFVGVTNILQASVKSVDTVGHQFEVVPFGTISLPAARSNVTLGDQVFVQIRPEFIHVTVQSSQAGDYQILSSRYVGDRQYLQIHHRRTGTELTASVPGAAIIGAGAGADITVDIENVIVL